jgi:hypothetical protein
MPCFFIYDIRVPQPGLVNDNGISNNLFDVTICRPYMVTPKPILVLRINVVTNMSYPVCV